MNKFFGTDGVRGRVGEAPMTVDFALRLASAAARVLAPGGGRVLIGKDTRVSGYMFESALEAGFVAAGVDVMLIGPLPTPGIAYMTQRLDCSFGVVISASHNTYQDNGIKFFDATGSKLSDAAENEIECLLDLPVVTQVSERLGKATRIDRSRTQYQEFCASTIPSDMNLRASRSSSTAPTARVQGGAARARRFGSRDRSHRLLAKRPQYQRWLWIDGTGAAATDGSRSARAARNGARRDGDGW